MLLVLILEQLTAGKIWLMAAKKTSGQLQLRDSAGITPDFLPGDEPACLPEPACQALSV